MSIVVLNEENKDSLGNAYFGHVYSTSLGFRYAWSVQEPVSREITREAVHVV